MKKLVLLSLIITAPAFGWDLKSIWNLKPSMETVSNAWQTMSPAMQKVTIAAGVAATVYAVWPLRKQKAYEQAEQCAKTKRNKIEKLTTEEIRNFPRRRTTVGVFNYGFFWQTQNKYSVDTSMLKGHDGTHHAIIQIIDWKNNKLQYRKCLEEQCEWSRTVMTDINKESLFFDGITDINKLD
ncbi:MAG: hypothetical protein BWY54_00806 [Candidatus Dependentiae bacterium ADurb.Bin331]|nr:MAG: hypothetical protein BWY54_00806 [Candidatus Dependentiae bacterium ADurb.Bin331]